MNRTFEELDAEVRALGYDTTCLAKDTPDSEWQVKIANRPFHVSWLSEGQVWLCMSVERRGWGAVGRAMPDLRATLWSAVVDERSASERRIATAQWEHNKLGVEACELEEGILSRDWDPLLSIRLQKRREP